MKTSRTKAFTLIELLVVITIIAVLAGLVLAAAGSVQKKGARSRAESEIAALGAALENYKADNGDYPVNTDSYTKPTNNTNLVRALMPSTGKVYYEFKTNSLVNMSGGTNSPWGYTDPWGETYGYYYNGFSPNNGTNNYDLWTRAGDPTGLKTNSWIKNW